MSSKEMEPKSKDEFLDAFQSLRPDLFMPENWSDQQREKAVHLVRPQRIKTGMLSAIPMSCKGPKCSFADICPLLQENLAPVGKPCPIEMAMVKEFFDSYVEELDVDVNRMVEVSMVRDLVDQEIQQNRATWLLSLEHFIQENPVGVDDHGKVVMKKELHLSVEYQDKIHRRKDKLRGALLATREARAKAGQGQLDTAQVVSNLMGEVRKIERSKEKLLRERLKMQPIEDAELLDE